MSKYPETPELNKMKSVQTQSQAIGDFLDRFLTEKGIRLGRPHEHGPSCRGWDSERDRYRPSGDDRCSFNSGEFESCIQPINKLLAEYFDIDLNKIDDERRAILAYIADLNAAVKPE